MNLLAAGLPRFFIWNHVIRSDVELHQQFCSAAGQKWEQVKVPSKVVAALAPPRLKCEKVQINERDRFVEGIVKRSSLAEVVCGTRGKWALILDVLAAPGNAEGAIGNPFGLNVEHHCEIMSHPKTIVSDSYYNVGNPYLYCCGCGCIIACKH